MIPHFINMIEKAGNTVHGIADHNKCSLDLCIKIDKYAIALWIVCFNGNYIGPTSIVIPIIAGKQAGESLYEIPCHTRPTSRVRGGIGDFGAGGWFGRPSDMASTVGASSGKSTSITMSSPGRMYG